MLGLDLEESTAAQQLLGLSFCCVAFYTFLRTLTFIHLKGKGNYVIKAFHFLICITALLRCAWCWTAKANADPLLEHGVDVAGPQPRSEVLAQSLHTLGTLALFCTFLILCCYWSYMLEHVTLKINVATDCFVPLHLLPDEGREGAGRSKTPRTWLGALCQTTVIELYLLAMRALLVAAIVNLACYIGGATSTWVLLRCHAALEAVGCAATVLALSILSSRIRVLLQTYGAQNTAAIEQHLDRVVKVTVGVNAFLLSRMACEGLFLYCSASVDGWPASLLGPRESLAAFAASKRAAEVVVLITELFVSRILARRGGGSGGGSGSIGTGTGSGIGTGSGSRVDDAPYRTASSQTALALADSLDAFSASTDSSGSGRGRGGGDIELASPLGSAGSSVAFASYSNKVLTASRSPFSSPTKPSGAASEKTPLLSSGLGKLAAMAALGKKS